MSNRSSTLYTGSTNDLANRVFYHKEKLVDGFTKRYGINRLVYYEVGKTREAAVNREKQIKGWTRAKKIALIESMNPTWRDLSQDFMDYEEKSESVYKPLMKRGILV
jgi:putative endonuclease